jgi:hypothetical protein
MEKVYYHERLMSQSPDCHVWFEIFDGLGAHGRRRQARGISEFQPQLAGGQKRQRQARQVTMSRVDTLGAGKDWRDAV